MSFAMWMQDEGVWERLWRQAEAVRGWVSYRWKLAEFEFSVASIVLGLLIFVVAVFLARRMRAYLERRMQAKRRLDPGLQYAVLRVVYYAVVIAGSLFALRTALRLDLTSLAVLFTALSVGIGFGLQFIAGDIASGFILLFERPVKVGDYITLSGPDGKLTEGRVQSINLRTTVVMTNDNIAAVMPNSDLVNRKVLNWSYRERRSRIAVPVGVSYDSDVDLVTETLLRAADDIEHVLAEPPPSVQFLGFGASALDFRLLVWIDHPRRHPKIKSDINYRIRHLFNEAGIRIPSPQHDINLRGGQLRVELAGADEETRRAAR